MKDPYELSGLSGDAAFGDELRRWRGRMIGHLAPRGDAWVSNGRLAVRTAPQLYSPNYPK